MSRLAVVGTGNLGEALLRGLLEAGAVARADVACVVRRPERAAALAAAHGVAAGIDIAAAVAGADVVVLGVKPQVVPEVLPTVAGALAPGTLVVSLAAGVTTATMEAALPAARVVRVMTNTPIAVRAAVSAVAGGASATAADVARATELFAPLGRVLVVDEARIDAVTALSGSGPAYVFLVAEALVAGGVALGLDEADALAATVGTLLGAARLLDAGGDDVDPAALRRAVTSPNGTTAAALAVLTDGDLEGLIARAMAAAAARAAELRA